MVICPSALEVAQVERLCNIAGDRPVVLVIPQLEDVAIVGIGYAARQLRERFISKLVSSYYFRPLDGAVVLRNFPSLWQVWLETENDNYQLLAEESNKPLGEALDRILMKTESSSETEGDLTQSRAKPSIFSSMRSFLKALSK